MTPHLWLGERIDDARFERRVSKVADWAHEAGAAGPPETEALLDAAEALGRDLREGRGPASEMSRVLREGGRLSVEEVRAEIAAAAAVLRRDELEAKLAREFGSTAPFSPRRLGWGDSPFEAWAPLGLLAHVAPANAPSAGALSVVEGLLAGNANIVKLSGPDAEFSTLLLEGLLARDATETLKNFVVAARFPSSRRDLLENILASADGVVSWGGEEALRDIRRLAPASARVIEWGHKISFIYLSGAAAHDEKILEAAAREVCRFEQQACSSPQCLYLDESRWEEVLAWGERFARVLERVSRGIARAEPSDAQAAEISLTTELARERACHGAGAVIEAADRAWRLLLDERPALSASPLHRTLWVKPLPRARLRATLRGMRAYLQTAGLASDPRDAAPLARELVAAGVARVRRVGEMSDSYSGEPHDGVYALPRLARRVSIQLADAEGFADLDDFRPARAPAWKTIPRIMTKADFQAAPVDEARAGLYFKSGGSSGEPKLSAFTYDDYRAQMRAGAEGLYAAGLDPARDRSMNLFFGGALYGGFLSVFSVLEELRAVQFPMAAQSDHAMVAAAIVRNRVDTLLGMPSYLVQLFEGQKEILGRYRGVKKIFYGGEHFNETQKKYLRDVFGVASIRSLGYGSVDAGPLGYQCRLCEGGEHHLHQRLQHLEILDLERDAPAAAGAVGRLVFTSRARRGQRVERYDIGDVGRFLPACPCGRAAPKFLLLGRAGDVFRVGTMFLNYRKFAATLEEKLGYAGVLQLALDCPGLKERVTVRLSSASGLDAARARAQLLADDADLAEAVLHDRVLDLEVALVADDAFERARGSGKVPSLVDRRTR